MLCSAAELGLGSDAEGIHILPDGVAVGTPLAELLGEVVLDVDVKPNRGDALSMIGLAREVAALSGATPARAIGHGRGERGAGRGSRQRRIEEPDLCPRFAARYFAEVSNGPSPEWMQRRLLAAGMRPISAVVDVTNYVMHELGQPMHAYDADAIRGGRIVVRRAHEGERLETIDHVERTLDPRMLVIADETVAIGLAGIMGGASTEVGSGTTSVILESAIFHGPTIRNTARRLALRSEASARHEKGIGPDLPRRAIDRAARPDRRGHRRAVWRRGSSTTTLTRSRRARSSWSWAGSNGCSEFHSPPTGSASCSARWASRQGRRGWACDGDGAELPPRRHWACRRGRGDRPGRGVRPHPVTSAAAGASGASARPDRGPRAGPARPGRAGVGRDGDPCPDRPRGPRQDGVPRDRRAPGARRKSAGHRALGAAPGDAIRRCSARCATTPASVAATRGSSRWGRCTGTTPASPTPRERRSETAGTGRYESWELGIALLGRGTRRSLHAIDEPADVATVKGIVDALHEALGAPPPMFAAEPEAERHPHRHPGRTAQITDAAGRAYGSLGEVHPRIASGWDLAGRPVDASLSLDYLLALIPETTRVTPVPNAQPIDRDLAVVLEQTVTVGELLRIARMSAGPMLADLRLFDAYRGPQVGEGRVSYALALRFQPASASDEKAVEKALNRVRGSLRHHLGAEIR